MQRRHMEPWWDDQEFINTGGKVLYSIDTDVVIFFTNPIKESLPIKGRTFGYAEVFTGTDPDRTTALGMAIVEDRKSVV